MMFMKAKDTNVSPSDCVSEVYNNLDLETREILPEKDNLINKAWKIQKDIKPSMPKQPDLLKDLEIPEEWQNLCEKGVFYDSKDDDENDRIILFTSESNLNMLFDCKQIAGDGTFKVPKIVRQIFILHGKVNLRFLPLVYIFMEKKNKASYIKIFKKLQQLKVIFLLFSNAMSFIFQLFFWLFFALKIYYFLFTFYGVFVIFVLCFYDSFSVIFYIYFRDLFSVIFIFFL